MNCVSAIIAGISSSQIEPRRFLTTSQIRVGPFHWRRNSASSMKRAARSSGARNCTSSSSVEPTSPTGRSVY